jgi:NDP-sugar pyrophosphorylase family protein
MSKRAIILAGGKGTRLKPYTIVLPKPLVPIGELPILEIVLRQLKQQGFTHITMAVNHMAELIMAFFGDGSKWGIKIDYSMEDKPLSTMGPLKLIKDLPENFLVMNGDILTDLKYGQFFDRHVQQNNIFSISSFTRSDKSEYGILETNEKQTLTAFKEKPESTFEVSMGIYALNKRVLEFIPDDTFFGFDHLMYALIDNKKEVAVVNHDGIWLDIGRPVDFQNAIDLFEKEENKFL